jgi:hypothetical protein
MLQKIGRPRGIAGLLQSARELGHTGEALGWIFGERSQHDLLDRYWQEGNMLAQRCRRRGVVLGTDFDQGTLEGTRSAEPFVGHDAKGILIAS